MKYFLDTDTCIHFLRGTHISIKEKIQSIPANKIKIPALVSAELIFGALKSKIPQTNIKKVELFMDPLEITPFDQDCGYVYAALRQDLEKKGKIIGPHDMLIAATVIRNSGILITHNTKEFKRIPNLNVESWV